MPELFLFGDSITWGASDYEGGGWAQRLRSDIDCWRAGHPDLWCPVYNLGIPGDGSADVASRFSAEIKARHEVEEQAVVLVSVGTNDSVINLNPESFAGSTTDYKNNLLRILDASRLFSAHIGFIGLMPVIDDLLNPTPWDHTKAYQCARVQEFDAVLRDFCARERVPFLDLWCSWNEAQLPRLLWDGVHPNAEGHRLLLRQIKSFLLSQRLLEKMWAE